jgi:hypothetical protein
MNSRYLGLVRLPAAAALAAVLLSACGGGGGGGGGAPPPATVTISGRITFDRIPFDTVRGNGLNPATVVNSPARQVTVQAIAATGQTVLATGTTDSSGNYSLSVPSNTSLFIRARAEMIKTDAAPTWNFSVRNNTTAGTNDALYAIDGSPASSGAANSTRDLNAPTGFGTNSYTGERAAAPFAILDTVFRTKELVLTATPNAAFPELRLFWSPNNRPTVGRFCPDDGDIGTSSYIVFANGELDDCNKPNADGIYVLGDFANGSGDTDEFDQSVIAHEFGHYVEDRFGRTDSIGGDHGGSETPLDLRVAFGEGWGNAFSAMSLGNPVYRDSQQGMQTEFFLDLEADDDVNEGWFSEISVGEILWDLFDATNEAGDTVALGFQPLFAVMTGAQVTTDALTSIFTLTNGLRAAQPTQQAGINALLNGEKINGTDDFGTGEMNFGGVGTAQDLLPIYRDIVRNDPPQTVCSRSPFGDASSNKLGNRVFLRFTNDVQRLVTITVNGANSGGGVPATDPDIFVLRRGALAAFGVGNTPGTETISQAPLPAGVFIIEVYDFDIDTVVSPLPRCMTVSVTGN